MKLFNTLKITLVPFLVLYVVPILANDNLCTIFKENKLSIIEIPKNHIHPNVDLTDNNTIKADINNDKLLDTVGQFYGGTLRVPYLKIMFSEGKSGEFGSSRYGAGSPKKFFLAKHEGRTIIVVKLKNDPVGYPNIPNYYLTEYAGKYKERFICEVRE